MNQNLFVFIFILIASLSAQTSYSEQKWIDLAGKSAFDFSRSLVIDATPRDGDEFNLDNCPIGFTGTNCDTGKTARIACFPTRI